MHPAATEVRMDTTVRSPLDVEWPTRVSARGVIAGMLVGLALAAMMMALGNAIGATAFPRTGSPRVVSVELAAWFLLSFTVGAFGGGWIAAAAAPALRRRDGVLHGLVTWAAIALVSLTLVGGVMRSLAVGMWSDGSLGSQSGDGLHAMSRHKGIEIGAWGGFAALIVPLLAAVGGGAIGAARERRVVGRRRYL